MKHESPIYKCILSQAGLPEIEVAFRESEVTHPVVGPELLPFNPLVDPIPEFRKPFTPTLGLSMARAIAPFLHRFGAFSIHGGKDALKFLRSIASVMSITTQRSLCATCQVQHLLTVAAYLSFLDCYQGINTISRSLRDFFSSTSTWGNRQTSERGSLRPPPHTSSLWNGIDSIMQNPEYTRGATHGPLLPTSCRLWYFPTQPGGLIKVHEE